MKDRTRSLIWSVVGVALIFLLIRAITLVEQTTSAMRAAQEVTSESRAVIREFHSTLKVVRESAVAQSGYIEATTRRSADIAQRTQLAMKHLDELIVAGKGTLLAANGTITQANVSIEQIRKDSVRVIDSAENAGESAAFAGQQVGFLAINLNEVAKHLNEGSEVAIKQLIAGTLEFREGVAELRERVADPRLDQMMTSGADTVAAMPQLVRESTEGVKLARKQLDTGAPGPVRKIINWLF